VIDTATARNLLMRLQGDVSAYNRGMNEAAAQARLLNRQLELTALQQNQNVRSSRFLAGQTQTTAQIQATFAQRIQQTSQLLQRIESEGGRNTDMYRRYQQRLIELQIQQERFNQSLRGTQETASRTTSAINNIKVANPLGNIASQAIGYATGQLLYTGMAKASEGVKSGFNFLDVIQQNTLAFETMTKSASQANSTVAQLWKMAKDTPFEFPDLLTAEKRLIAFKFDLKDIPGLLTAVGNASSGLGLVRKDLIEYRWHWDKCLQRARYPERK
jgi:hypothetical protein